MRCFRLLFLKHIFYTTFLLIFFWGSNDTNVRPFWYFPTGSCVTVHILKNSFFSVEKIAKFLLIFLFKNSSSLSSIPLLGPSADILKFWLLFQFENFYFILFYNFYLFRCVTNFPFISRIFVTFKKYLWGNCLFFEYAKWWLSSY